MGRRTERVKARFELEIDLANKVGCYFVLKGFSSKALAAFPYTSDKTFKILSFLPCGIRDNLTNREAVQSYLVLLNTLHPHCLKNKVYQ